ncbi:MAG: preprotein translocase subunit SecY [Armatimonadetes bacterium]|nr:preprotein translocase subunit SecY [Armatimonadota bacterium]MDW8153604.1 preprotein translocase subunit SecY [Armatimonadota bacterium]
MISGLANPLRIPDLRRRLLFTALMLALFRLGAHIPVPGVNVEAVRQQFQQAAQGTAFGFLNLLVGGALENFSIFALGVIPYITASIIMSLLQVAFPRLKEMAREEGEAGRRRIGWYTLYLTIPLAALQAWGQTGLIQAFSQGRAITDFSPLNWALILSTLVAGTMVLTWMGEVMTEHGVGNGVSLLIFGGIVARIPQQIAATLATIQVGSASFLLFLLDVVLVLASIVAVIFITQATRRIPVQYARRVVGRRVLGGQTTHLPMKIVQAGVIPIIFAISVLQFPSTVASFVRWQPLVDWGQRLQPGQHWLGTVLYAVLIIVFTYFYTAVQFDPDDIAENIKKYGGFIPGIRPGRPTSEFLMRVTERLTFVGALFLSAIAVLPLLFRAASSLTLYLAGTSVLIVVGVALETMRQLEAYVLMRHYEGFLR